VAENPWLWRVGWIPWQITALSDLLIAFALIRTRWIPRLPALLVIVATVAAVAVEQPGEFRWMTEGVRLAKEAHRTRIYSEYRAFEWLIFRQVGALAAALYTVAAIGWTWCFATARTWSRFLTRLSIVTWSLLLLVAVCPLLFAKVPPVMELISIGNAIGFVLLMLWLALVTEKVLRRSRSDEAFGRMARWRYPLGSPLGSLLNLAANSRTLRAFGELLPTPTFVSDITDVIYVNYVVEESRLEALLPPYLELQRLGPDGKYALFTFLTYNHGHFGPQFLGPLRRLMPSPVQSNWRIHVRDPQTGVQGIYFISTAITNPLNALAARHLSEGVPMHVPKSAEVTRQPDGSFRLLIDPGTGSAPDVDAELKPSPVPDLAPPWGDCFANFPEFLAYCVPQDRAMSSQPWYRRVTRQEIRLDIPLDQCEPLAGAVRSKAAERIVGDAKPLCFRVARVNFRYDREEYDKRKPV
jgi:hypothetical protein